LTFRRNQGSQSIVSVSIGQGLINVWTAFIGGYVELLTARFSSGLTTTLAYTVGVCFLARTSRPDRIYGLLMVLQTLFFSADAILLPVLNVRFGYFTAVASAAVWLIAAGLGALWLPDGQAHSPALSAEVVPRDVAARPLVGGAALLGAFLLQLSIFAVWGFLDRLGHVDGFSDEQIGYGIGIGVLGGIPGGLLPSLIGERFGRLPVIGVAVIVLVVSYVALGQALHLSGYTLWIAILNVGWVLGLSYYMGLTVTNDPNGRFTRLISFSQILSAGVGPACSALVIHGDRLAPIFGVAITSVLTGYTVVLAASIRSRRQA
jgi:hypothetical protein